jgi:hypothetical protein
LSELNVQLGILDGLRAVALPEIDPSSVARGDGGDSRRMRDARDQQSGAAGGR